MRAGLYANPAFASGLSDMLAAFTGGGDPRAVAAAELAASEAGLNNDTRRYRENIGAAGDANDLAGLLVSSLQAGRDYSAEAPEIAASLGALPEFGMGDRDFGRLLAGTGVQNVPGGTIADMLGGHAIQGAAPRGGGGGGGRRSGGGGGGAPAASKPRALTRGATAALLSALEEKGLTPDEAYTYVGEAEGMLAADPNLTENSVLAQLVPSITVEERVVDPNDSWFDPSDWWTGPETERVVNGPAVAPPDASAPPAPDVDAESALAEARDAIAAGADRVTVMLRLREMGIDPAGL